LKYIIEQDKTAARRTTDYGFVAKKRQNQEYLSKMFYPYLGRVLRFVFKRI